MKAEHIRIAVKYLQQQDSQFAQDLAREVEAERQSLWDAADAEWNAAIEAAAEFAREAGRRVRAETASHGELRAAGGEACARTLEKYADSIVVLKREAK